MKPQDFIKLELPPPQLATETPVISTETTEIFKKELENTVSEITRGFTLTMKIYMAVFATGLALMVFSALLAIFSDKALLSIIFGAMGMANILSFFFSRTPVNLQRCRGELAQLQAGIFNWYVDIRNWNNYLRRHEDTLTLDELKRLSDEQMARTEQTIKLIRSEMAEYY